MLNPIVRHSNYFFPIKDAVWGERVILDLELVYILKGEFVFQKKSEKSLFLTDNTMLVIFPDEPHTLKRINNRKSACIACLHCDLIPNAIYNVDYIYKPTPERVTSISDDSIFLPLFKQCAEIIKGHSRFREDLLSQIAAQVWTYLAEIWNRNEDKVYSIRIEEIIEYIGSNLGKSISRTDLASRFGLTPEYLSTIFKKETGVAPFEFIQRKRILKAYSLIVEEGVPIKKAATMSGFSDQFYFSKVFKKIMGVSPSRYLPNKT